MLGRDFGGNVMDDRTLKALKASIEHWEENALLAEHDWSAISSESCALCDEFSDSEECYGCPVAKAANASGCIDTPWEDACGAMQRWIVGRGSGKAFRKAAQDELDFLRSLLPESEQ